MTNTKKTPRNTLAMTVEFYDDGVKTAVEIHTLNPGEFFPNFGGSKHGCFVNKTASIITRTMRTGISDYEQDIYAPDFWAWIGRLIERKGLDGKHHSGSVKIILPQ